MIRTTTALGMLLLLLTGCSSDATDDQGKTGDADAAMEEAIPDVYIRAQVSEGLNIASSPRAAVTEYFLEHGVFPADNLQAGLRSASDIKGQYVVSLEVRSGIVFVEFGNEAHPSIYGQSLELTPSAASARVIWRCSSPGIESSHLPEVCRN